MPAFYPEGDEPKLADPSGRSLHKINNLLKSIEAKTGSATITGPVTVTNEVEIKNDANNPLPVSDNNGSLTVDGTVELGATSLSALENIQVAFPSTQNVSVQNASLAVTGTFFQATQPVSATALPLPSGASTETTLSAVNTKIPSNLTVSSTRLLVDGSGVTQPISGTVTDTNLGATNDSAATTDTGTFSVIALIKRGLQNWTSLLAKIPTLVSGRIPVDGSGVTQPISGTVTANTGLTQPLTDTQLRAAVVPVSLASVPSHPVTGSGPFTAAQATAANLNATVVGSGSFTAAQSTASALKAQAQILNSAGSLVTYAETGTYGSPSVDVISVQNPQGVTATITTFTSTTASTSLVAANSTRKALTVYNSGAGDLYISPTAVCTTTNFQVKLSSGDFWECPPSQVLLSHTGVFATSGTAYITSLT